MTWAPAFAHSLHPPSKRVVQRRAGVVGVALPIPPLAGGMPRRGRGGQDRLEVRSRFCVRRVTIRRFPVTTFPWCSPERGVY